MDTRTPQQRRRIMQAIKSRDTKPEMVVRRCLHAMGYRYRLHRKDLPGRPDIMFAGRRKGIFVHGCFWHRHGCAKGRLPKSRLKYWKPKLDTIQNVNDRWPNLQELIDCDGAINIGRAEWIRAAVATQGRDVLVQLRLGEDESLLKILDRLDTAVAGALQDGIFIDEINR